MKELCRLCKRPLDDPTDPKSLDCGGDCLGCIEEIEDRWKEDEE